MNRKQFLLILFAVVISSFLGGMFTQFIYSSTLVSAKEFSSNPKEIRTKAVHLVGQGNKIRASFYLSNHDHPQLVLYDKMGTNRFNLGLAPDGNSGISLNDEKFNKLIDLDTSHGNAKISLMDSGNKIIWQVPNIR